MAVLKSDLVSVWYIVKGGMNARVCSELRVHWGSQKLEESTLYIKVRSNFVMDDIFIDVNVRNLTLANSQDLLLTYNSIRLIIPHLTKGLQVM